MTSNSELKAEADLLMRRASLTEVLSGYDRWFVGGSYSYDLMCWRDLDLYIFDPEHNLQRCFEVGFELAGRLDAKKARFTNNVISAPGMDEPAGFYSCIKLGDERQGAWKIDIWFLDQPEYEEHQKYSADMCARLTPDTSAAIREIKEAYWRRREYRDKVTSGMIYRAVLNNGVRSLVEFEGWVDQLAQ